MSHYKERKEKICLNCNAHLHGRYCHNCGQENIEPKETFWGLTTHFLYDITHFDTKFFNTLKYLLFKPGFLSKEFVRGRRARYLHPIRMYVFTSAFFFIIFFWVFKVEELHTERIVAAGDSALADPTQLRETALKGATTREDSMQIEKLLRASEQLPVKVKVDSAGGKKTKKAVFSIETTKYTSKEAYDSAQMRLPENERDGWYKRQKIYRQIEVNKKLEKDPEGLVAFWVNKLVHSFPQLLFVSLPIFALLLKMLYARRKQFYYSDHAIFSIHLYIFTFIGMLIFFGVSKLKNLLDWDWLRYIVFILLVYILLYTYLAMRNFYQQNLFKTFVKYFLLGIMSLLVILFLFVAFFVLSIFQI